MSYFRWVALTILLLTPFAIHAADGSPTLEISVNDQSVSLEQILEFEVRILNSTSDDLWLFGDLRWGPGGGLELNVGPWERDGPLPLFIDHAEFTKEELTDISSFVRLRPGAFIGRKRQVKVSDLVRKPGEYRVWVQYQSPLAAAAFRLPFWSAEKPSLMSRVLILKVARSSIQKR